MTGALYMKILYLTPVNIDTPSSVLNKMNAQIEEWNSFGHEVYVASLPIFKVKEKHVFLTPKASGFFVFKNLLVRKFFTGGFFNMGSKILTIWQYKNYINSVSPNIIYLREIVGFPGLASVLKKYKVALESNTVLMDELQANSKILYQLAKLYQDKVNKEVDGFVGVTNEVTNQFLKYNKPSVTITNGIKMEHDNLSPAINSRPQVIMVSSPGCLWHGTDKYIKMARLLPGIDFFLAGPEKKDFNISLKNLFIKGYLSKAELKKLYSKMDIAVGTLALHRNNMKEASPIKVREYAAFGLPMILAYQDTDFSDKGLDFILQIENSEQNVENNIATIGDFIYKWKGKRIKTEDVEPLISITLKEEKRLEFFKKILNNAS